MLLLLLKTRAEAFGQQRGETGRETVNPVETVKRERNRKTRTRMMLKYRIWDSSTPASRSVPVPSTSMASTQARLCAGIPRSTPAAPNSDTTTPKAHANQRVRIENRPVDHAVGHCDDGVGGSDRSKADQRRVEVTVHRSTTSPATTPG